MTYQLKTVIYRWGVESDEPRNRVLLKHQDQRGWTSVNFFSSFEEAAAAVANSNTSLNDWDSLRHDPSIAQLDKWIMSKGAFLD